MSSPPTLDNFKNLTYEERKNVTFNMPKRMRVNIFLKHCSDNQIMQLIDEWKETGNEKMLTAMRRGMKKHKKYKHLFK